MNLQFSYCSDKAYPPSPCYDSLRNNIATPLLRTTLNDWPENTPDYVNHHVLLEYIQETSKRTGVDKVTEYGALVTKIYKQGQKWQLNWTSLLEDTQTGDFVETYHSSVSMTTALDMFEGIDRKAHPEAGF